MALKIGIAGPVGSGKTSLIESLTNLLKDKYSLAIVTNDIYTTEDANYLKEHLDLDSNRITGVETGGCPPANEGSSEVRIPISRLLRRSKP